MVVGIALLFAGCSTGLDMGPRFKATDVVAVQTTAYPEGPSLRIDQRDPVWPRIAAALPATLPLRLAQPSECSSGNITTIMLRNGSTIAYGPCNRPRSIDALRCLLAHASVGCT